ncbi:MAG: hypothetical protein COB37_06825 [Kordiimonadales bacterium]|nr:MAG: hypothetical protein COB37_06825 [Kordiimonadales bacterium]
MALPNLFRELPDGVRGRLTALGGSISYAPDQLIQTRGDFTRGLSVISEGAVCFGKNDADGRFIASTTFEVGQSYGEFTLFTDLPRTHDAIAVGATTILNIPKNKFDSVLATEPALVTAVLTVLTMRLHNALELVDDLRRYPLKYRLGKNLLQMAKTEKSNQLHITQSELADVMGVSRVAIGHILTLYKKQGFIEQKYGYLELMNGEGLKEWLETFVQLDDVTPPITTDLGVTPPTQ